MRTILKIIAAPLILALILAVAVLSFLSCVAGAVCVVACVGLSLLNEVLVTYVQVLAQVNMPSRKVRLRGFDPAKKYRLEGTDEVYSGEMLMNAGFRMKDFRGDFVSRLYHFIAVD